MTAQALRISPKDVMPSTRTSLLKDYGFTVSGAGPCYVSHVEPGSVAEDAGLRLGDLIVEVGGYNVWHMGRQAVHTLAVHAAHILCELNIRVVSGVGHMILTPTELGSGVEQCEMTISPSDLHVVTEQSRPGYEAVLTTATGR